MCHIAVENFGTFHLWLTDKYLGTIFLSKIRTLTFINLSQCSPTGIEVILTHVEDSIQIYEIYDKIVTP